MRTINNAGSSSVSIGCPMSSCAVCMCVCVRLLNAYACVLNAGYINMLVVCAMLPVFDINRLIG